MLPLTSAPAPARPLSSAPGTHLLDGHDEDTALVVADRHVTYATLRAMVAERRAELGTTRRLVLLQASAALDPVVTHLAALAGGHPVLLAEGGAPDAPAGRHLQGLIDRFDPDVVAHGAGEGSGLRSRRRGTRHSLHPDLAVLLSTSGSTGSPKLVRLSSRNVRSNAEAIAGSLRLTSGDRAPTTMPLHYCYGLSVLHSHLVAGAGVHLTERSVVEEEFWSEFVAAGDTSFAGVPYTFDLLDATGFATRTVPGLRCITQAGGRLAPERVRAYARLGRERGFDLVVMYGQTEATARMAYVPPHLAEQAAGAVGIPVPGARLRVDAEPGQAVGELVFTGPGVMLGYAEDPADLAAGRTVHELRTGDLGRLREDGLVEVVGRADRVVKVFGLRIDLDRVETLLGSDRVPVRAVGLGDRLVLFVTAARHERDVRAQAGELLHLPPHAVQVHAVAAFPRTSTGKPDTAALVRYAAGLGRAVAPAAGHGPDAVLGLYRELLGRPDAGPEDSFAVLDGDSLSYVELSIRLEDLLGDLPRDWPSMSVRELGALLPAPDVPAPDVATPTVAAPVVAAPDVAEPGTAAPGAGPDGLAGGRARTRRTGPRRARTRRWSRVETPTLLRAVAIVLVVGTHADAFTLQGGAHLLLAVVGYNLARFHLADVPGRSRVGPLLRGAMAVALPAGLWIGAVSALTGYYRPTTALLLTNVVSTGEAWTVQWQFWFLEVVVWSVVGLAALLAVPGLDRLERRHPYGVALAVLLLALGLRLVQTGGVLAGPMERYSAPVLLWVVALGWLVARSRSVRARAGASVLAVVSVAGFLGDPLREGVIVAGVLLLLWVPSLPVPRVIVPALASLAAASMFIYLSHWQVYPPFEETAPWLGLLLSLGAGLVLRTCWRTLSTAVAARLRRPVQAPSVTTGPPHRERTRAEAQVAG